MIHSAAPRVSHNIDTQKKGVDMLPFTYPEISRGKETYVWFLAEDPARNGKMFRKRYRLNHIPTKTNREKTARLLARKLTEKLEEGWNPWIEERSTGLQYITIGKAIDEILQLKKSFVRRDTYKAYCARTGIFKTWLAEAQITKMYCFDFRADDAQRFMDWLLTTRDIGKRTYNNYRLDLATFFNEMMKRNYTLTNPFSKIHDLHADEKKRNSFSRDELDHLRDYLLENDFDFYIVFQYTYLCGLRNSEITRLRVGDVDLDSGRIYVSGSVSKTHRQDNINILSENFLAVLRDYLRPFPKNYYLVGQPAVDARARNTSEFKPSVTQRSGASIGHYFTRIAKKLGFRSGLSFYSAKDTLASNLIDMNEDITTIQKFLRHKNLASTQAYIAKRKPVVSEKARRLKF